MYEMFHTRYSMHKQVYTHKVGKAIEYMISDALLLADPFLKISEAVDSPERYCYLTDSIVQTIEASKAQVIHVTEFTLIRNWKPPGLSLKKSESGNFTNLLMKC